MKTVKPESAGRYFNALAYSYAHTGDLREARRQAESAKKWNRNEDKQQTEELVEYLDTQDRNRAVAQPR